MVKSLRQLLKSPFFPLFLKAAIFGGFLALVKAGNFGVVPILFFSVASIFLYSQPLFNSFALLFSFGVLIALSFLVTRITGGLYIFLAADLFLSSLFFLILGLKNLVFINRDKMYFALNILLFYAAFIIFFLSDRADYFLIKSLALFLMSFLLFRESFKFFNLDRQKKNLAPATMAFLVFEAAWAVSLLPLGFLGSANLMALSVFLLSDLILRYFQNSLSRRVIFVDASIFILLTLVIFATTKWSV